MAPRGTESRVAGVDLDARSTVSLLRPAAGIAAGMVPIADALAGDHADRRG